MTRTLLLSTAMLLATGAAQAQTPPATQAAAPDTGLEDIVVTAQRRNEAVQDVPIAVSAFSAASLEAKGITQTLNLISYVPNMFGSNNTGLGSANAYYIRGLGNTETIATFDPPVGTYIDDVYMSRQNANNFSFFDLERIEVLRGPQGTLFGRNTTGGAVNAILKKPSDTLGGYLEAGYGSYDKVLLRGSVDLPMSEMVQFKISGYYADDRGYAYNSTTKEHTNDNDMAGLRGAVQLKITEGLTWNAAVAYMRNDGENLLNWPDDPRNTANSGGRFLTTGMVQNYTAASPSPYVGLGVTGRKAGFGLGNKTDTMLYTSNIEYRGEQHTLNLITGVIDMRQKFALDFADGRGLPNIANPNPAVTGYTLGGFAILNDGKHKQVTQEIKLNGKLFGDFVDYVVGGYFYDEKNTTDFADVFTLPFAAPPRGFPLLLADRTLNNNTTAKAGYAQFDLNVTEQLKLTAGIRYTDEKKTFQISDNRASCAANPLPIGCLNNNLVASNGVAIPTTQRTKLWTPRFALNFKPNDDVLLFASATRGFKSGGWNARGTRRDTLLPFDPEVVWSYEVGAKTEWLDRRLRVNLTGFVLDTKALQTPSAFVNPSDGSVTFITQNFADYQNKGLELEITAVPVEGLNVFLNVGYQDDKYKVDPSLAPNRYGVKSVRQQQADCKAQLAAGRVPLAPAGASNAPDCAAGIVDANGNIATPVRTPDWSLALGASYDFAMPSAGIIVTPSVNAAYRSRLETGTANATIYSGQVRSTATGTLFPTNPFSGDFITGSRTNGFWQVNASLTLRTDDNNWTVAVECSNCFDKYYAQSSLVNYTYISPPRSWMVRAKRNF
ncbi:TonB-dependent receptor [Sandaracinobacteroides saxicola]|uniref:TonB-dependent receptor n=1 Tax=Sandaracinobacteroides saxicola TaxID=2759707 RepID=A0A7G5IGL1_9SPHN|nr:TonB-dependent receptor [Sandaracinobacteroides saxicola]QMW22503.1 TonB-dependent receptor [Sandaracinobacteroides saxicola]